MRWPRVAIVAALSAALGGCGGGEPEATPGEPAAAAQTEDSAVTSPAPPATEPVIEPAAQRPVSREAEVRAEEPWTPTQTGTVSPGMTREDVVAVWGDPVTERVADGRGYLYFRNGCEVRCGTYDVVFLDGGQVVDAIVRGPGHEYAGTSSSPAGRQAMPTPPGQPGSTGMP